MPYNGKKSLKEDGV